MAAKPTYVNSEKAIVDPRSTKRDLKLLISAVEQSSEGIAVIDLDGNLEYLNNAFAEMHGYSAEELVGKNLSTFHTPEQMPSVKAANLELKHKGNFKGEIWHVKRDGTEFPTRMNNSLIRDEMNKPIGMIGTLRDITEMKKTEEKIKAYSEKLKSMVDERTKKLESKTNKLEEVNVALNVLLEKREKDKILLQEQVLSNVKRLALPYVEKLKNGNLTETQIALLDVIESSLHEIVSPFSLKLSSNSFGLTPAEIKVASLIKQGKGTKEIAKMRNLSHKTVARHRENIRNKLGIKNTKVNLQSHLTSLA